MQRSGSAFLLLQLPPACAPGTRTRQNPCNRIASRWPGLPEEVLQVRAGSYLGSRLTVTPAS
jgi:hypothetical protein